MKLRYFLLINLVAALAVTSVALAAPTYIAPAIGEISATNAGKERVVLDNGRLAAFTAKGKLLAGFPVSQAGYYFYSAPVLADLDGNGVKEIGIIGNQGVAGNDTLFVFNGAGTLVYSALLGTASTNETVFYDPISLPVSTGVSEKILVSTKQGNVYEFEPISTVFTKKLLFSLAGPGHISTNKLGTEIYVGLPSSAALLVYTKQGNTWVQKNSFTISKTSIYSTFDQTKNRWYGVSADGVVMAINPKTGASITGWPVITGVLAGPVVIAETNSSNAGNEVVGVQTSGKRVVLSEAGVLLTSSLKSRSFLNTNGDLSDQATLFTWSPTGGQIIANTKNILGNYYSRINLPDIQFTAPPVVTGLSFGEPVYGANSTVSVSASAAGSSVIASAEYYVVDANNVESAHVPLLATDGAFNAATESISGTVTMSAWNADAAPYMVMVVATDAAGNQSAPVGKEFTVIDQTDSDDSVTGFGGGVKNNLVWNSTKLMLNGAGLAAGSGDFTSRVIDARADTVWNMLSWTPLYPYGKPLPNNEQKESGYTTGNVDMKNTVLLYHFDGNLTDSSGKNHNGVWQGTEEYTSGIYDQSVTLNPGYVNAGASDDFKIAKNITMEAWIKPTDSSSYKTIMARDGSYYLALNALKPVVFLNGVSTVWQQATTAVPLNTWTHVAASYDGTTLKIFINGVLNRSVALTGTIATPAGKELWIGNRPENLSNYFYRGQIDEVAILNRLLTPGEIFAHFRRGAFGLKFQVRSCADSICGDADFVGPDGTGNSYYSEWHNSSVGLPQITLNNVANNRFFQYKTIFETKLKTFGPEISAVVVGPGHVKGEGSTPPSTSTLIDQTDDDNSVLGFGGGIKSETAWQVTALELTAQGKVNGIGSFESRILNATKSVAWNAIAWKPSAPYAKALPDNAGKENYYAKNNVDMTKNELLAHFNEPATTPANTTAPITGVVGVQDKAVEFDGVDDRLSLGSAANLAISGPITLEAWVKPTGTGIYRTIMTRNTSYYLSLSNLKPAVYFVGLNKPGWHVASSAIPLNVWSHVVAVYDGASIKIYINGVLDQTIAGVSGAISTEAGKEVWVGNRLESNYAYKGSLDEVAIYSRALTQSEIVARYERNAVRLKFQVRVCATDNCSDVTYTGPDGTAATYFTDMSTTTLPLITLNPERTGQYFQYKVWFETSNSVLTPKLGSVKIGPAHNWE